MRKSIEPKLQDPKGQRRRERNRQETTEDEPWTRETFFFAMRGWSYVLGRFASALRCMTTVWVAPRLSPLGCQFIHWCHALSEMRPSYRCEKDRVQVGK